MPAKPISVRPRQSAEAKILQLAAELDKSPGQLLADAAEAIVEMVEARVPRVPKIVRVARALRQSGISFASTDSESFADDVRVLRVAEEAPVYASQPQSTASAAAVRSPRTRGRRGAREKAKSA